MAARGFGLSAERSHLALQLPCDVAQSQQVGVGSLQPPDGTVFAEPMFEDACRFLNGFAVLISLGVEDRVDLALSDNHVLLAADATVRQQLLDVEQPAVHSVDLVLGSPIPEQAACDRYVVEVERQVAIGIVEDQRDLGPAERRASGGPGEDHVFHRLGTEGPGRLRAHHPGDGIDDVRLACSIGTDDHRHTRLEFEARSVRKRFETDKFQRSQIQVTPLSFTASKHISRGSSHQLSARAQPSSCRAGQGENRRPVSGVGRRTALPRPRPWGSQGWARGLPDRRTEGDLPR